MKTGSYFDENFGHAIPSELIRNRRKYGLTIKEVVCWCYLTAENKPTNTKSWDALIFGSRTTKWRVIKKLKTKGLLDTK